MGAVDTIEWALSVAIIFEMTEQVEQRICIKFCVKLEHSCVETIWKIQKAVAMGNWWLAASSQQCTHMCITSHAEFFRETSSHSGHSAPLQPRFVTLWLLAFPKTKITLEREENSDHQWDSGKYDRAADGDWKNCVRSQGAYFEGTEASLSCVQCHIFNRSHISEACWGSIQPCNMK